MDLDFIVRLCRTEDGNLNENKYPTFYMLFKTPGNIKLYYRLGNIKLYYRLIYNKFKIKYNS